MALEQIIDHAAQGIARLCEQLKGKVNLEALLAVFLAEVQALEGALFGLLAGYNVDTAVGVQLDVIGALVGQARGGADDDTYRLRIRARQRINRSNGTPEDLYFVFHALEPLADIAYVPEYPAGLRLVLSGAAITGDEASEYAEFLAEAASAGVRVVFQFLYGTDAETFRFDTGPGFDFGTLAGTL